jgi:hypothetical protein
MDAEAACIICNWANNVLWPYFGLGALGAGAAAAAAAGGPFGGDEAGHDEIGQDDAGADQTMDQTLADRGDKDAQLRERKRLMENGDWGNADIREAWHDKWWGPREDSWYEHPRIIEASEMAERWARDILGIDPENPSDRKGTTAAASKA